MAVDNWDEATFRAFYRTPSSAPGGEWIVGYSRDLFRAGNPEADHLAPFRRRWTLLVAAFGIASADRVLIVGAAFGFLIEAAHEAGFPNVYGIDSSPEIPAKRGTEIAGSVVIVEDDVRGGGRVRSALRQATGSSSFDWVVTEDVVSCYAPADVVAMAPLLETLLEDGLPSSRVVHYTNVAPAIGVPGGDSALTWLTLAEWKALVPGHSWVSYAFEVL